MKNMDIINNYAAALYHPKQKILNILGTPIFNLVATFLVTCNQVSTLMSTFPPKQTKMKMTHSLHKVSVKKMNKSTTI